MTRSILILRSKQTHEDINLVITKLEAVGVLVQVFDVGLLFTGELSFDEFTRMISWEEIAAIDIRYCRGLPRNWEKGYKSIFSKLDQFLKKQQKRGNIIRVTPSMETLEWVLDKAAYLPELQALGIPTVPTVLVPPLPSASSSTDDFNIVDYADRYAVEGIVLKPAVGSGADNLEFISKVKNGKFKYQVERYQRDSSDLGKKELIPLKDDRDLISHFQNYRSKSSLPTLVQNYMEVVREISAVYVDGAIHFVERLTGKNNRIAHEKFGGKNILILEPPQSWKSFARDVYLVLPEVVKNEISIRIDIFQCLDGRLLLSEIEGASHRLFFPEFLQFFKEHPDDQPQEITNSESESSKPLENYLNSLLNLIH